ISSHQIKSKQSTSHQIKAQHITAQHSTAQHSTAQHSTAQHNYTLITVNLTEKYEENTTAVRLNRRAAGVFSCKTAVL
ncbi:MAG: hypothetical protein SOZ27_04835, partial [Spirochaetia bacterium]|nr:hypothetical protein [Spirochaetia bacterium]